jgi:hypothetical protein
MPGHHEVTLTDILNRDLMAVCQHDQRAGGTAPAAVELWTPEALRLGRWDALDQRAVDQLQLVHLLVVVSDQYLGNDGQEP